MKTNIQLCFVVLGLSLAFGCSKDYSQNAKTNPVKTAVVAIEFPKTGLSASLVFPAPPKMKVPTSFVLKFWDTKTGNADTGPFINPRNYDLTRLPKEESGEKAIFLFMPSMGHGSSPLTITKKNDNGVYFEVTQVKFTMKGKWEIIIELRDENDKVDETGIYSFEQK